MMSNAVVCGGPSSSLEISGDNSNKDLTILVITYNHSAYIKKSLESVVSQNYPNGYEVIIADDASTDNTREVIREFFLSYPNINVRFLDYSANRGISKNYQRAFAAVQTKYVAVMEGDDIWSSPYKLQRQINVLENNSSLVACSVNYLVWVEAKNSYYPRVKEERDRISYLDGRSLIRDNLIGNFSTTMYRSSALRGLPAEMFTGKSYDWITHIILCQQGLIAMLHEVMSIYRIHSNGTWSRATREQQILSQIEQIGAYNRYSGNVYSAEWEALSASLNRELEDIRRMPADAKIAEGGRISDPKTNPDEAVEPSQGRRSLAGKIVRWVYIKAPDGLINFIKMITPQVIRKKVRHIGISS